MLIRELKSEDLPGVAALFLRVFRNRQAGRSQSLINYLREIYLCHPWSHPALPSRVALSDAGEIVGFVGVLPLRMRFGDEPVLGAVCGALMVDPRLSGGIAGAQILRSFMNGSQVVSLSDNATIMSRNMWLRLRGSEAPLCGLEFRRVLRPATDLSNRIQRRKPKAPLWLARPFLDPLDRFAARYQAKKLLLPDPGEFEVADASEDELVKLIPGFAAGRLLRPEWDEVMLRWLLQRAAEKHSHGPLQRKIVVSPKRGPVGCFLYYGLPGHRAEVLDILAFDHSMERVVDALMFDSYRNGFSSVEGRVKYETFAALNSRGFAYHYGSASLISSSRSDIVAAGVSGNASLGGLAGEGWSRLFDDDFEIDAMPDPVDSADAVGAGRNATVAQ
jgi:hypothetical protein